MTREDLARLQRLLLDYEETLEITMRANPELAEALNLLLRALDIETTRPNGQANGHADALDQSFNPPQHVTANSVYNPWEGLA